jgi:malate permease and related proteins
VLRVFVDVILPVMLIAAIGGVVGRRLGLPVEPFSQAIFYLFNPCLVFTLVASVDLAGGDIVGVVVVGVAVFAVNVVVAQVWGRVKGEDERTIAGLSLASSISNQGNLGLPISRLAFGSAGLEVGAVAFVTGVVLWSAVGVTIASIGRMKLSHALLAPLSYPAVYAAALGTIVNVTNVDLPTAIDESVGVLADASIPVMLLVLGLQLHVPQRGQLLAPLAVSVNRLVIGPLVALLTAAALGLHGVPRAGVLIAAGMPTAVMVTVISAELDARPELGVRAVIVSTLLSIVTLTVLITLLD